MTKIIDPTVEFLEGDHDAQLVVKHQQDIPQEHLDSLKEARAASTTRKMGDWHRAASIPTSVYEAWLRSGYDAQKEPIAKTMAKLRQEGLDYFITTDRRL
jgi:hypothetical protein